MMDTGGFHGYDTSEDYFVKAVWPLASRELRRLSKGRDFAMRGPGRVLRGREVAEELSGKMVELIVDVPDPKRGRTDPLIVRADGGYIHRNDGEYSVHMESPFFIGTHGSHAPMSGDPQTDAASVAGDIADMVDDMRFARPGLEEGLAPKGPAPTANARRIASRLAAVTPSEGEPGMKTFTIEVSGASLDDVEIAIDEVKRLVSEGYLSGSNENDTGSFSFNSSGEYGGHSEDGDEDDMVDDMRPSRPAARLAKWRGRLQDEYADYEEWCRYSDTYGLAGRLGFPSNEAAWEANPTVEGSTNPADYRTVPEGEGRGAPRKPHARPGAKPREAPPETGPGLDPEDMAARWPDLWPTAEDAARDLRRRKAGTETSPGAKPREEAARRGRCRGCGAELPNVLCPACQLHGKQLAERHPR